MVNILVTDQSYLVASGLASLLYQIKEVNEVKVADNGKDCLNIIEHFDPQIIFINTASFTTEEYDTFKQRVKNDVVIQYLFYSMIPDDVIDNQLSVVQSKAALMDKLQKVIENACRDLRDDDQTEELSPREKSILKCVALGLTNKEIAEKEFISTHTVISHRKNITRKLGIKTVSGLTVYAIINNIINMNDIR